MIGFIKVEHFLRKGLLLGNEGNEVALALRVGFPCKTTMVVMFEQFVTNSLMGRYRWQLKLFF